MFCVYELNEFIIASRNGDGESIINGRNVRMVAEQHYADAHTLFNQLEHWDEVIRLQLEKAGVYEFQLKRMYHILFTIISNSLFILKFFQV
jgi:hypothetical protein